MSKAIDLIIFDFDGTIADSLPAAIKSVQMMLKDLGYPDKTAAEIGQFIGFGERPLVAGSIGSDDPAAVATAQAVYYQHNCENIKEVKLYPHVTEFLDQFKEKIKIIVSNKRDKFIKLILEAHQMLASFAEILGGDSSPCLKPDPCAILTILSKYKVSPERALLVGDMSIDILTGRNAGIRTCAVTYGFTPRAELERLQPDFIIDDILDLTAIIS